MHVRACICFLGFIASLVSVLPVLPCGFSCKLCTPESCSAWQGEMAGASEQDIESFLKEVSQELNKTMEKYATE